jgi:hypothetical protein
MRTVHVLVVETEQKTDLDFWVTRLTAERNHKEALKAGHKVYFFSVLVDTVIDLETRLMRSAEYFSLFNGFSEPVRLTS